MSKRKLKFAELRKIFEEPGENKSKSEYEKECERQQRIMSPQFVDETDAAVIDEEEEEPHADEENGSQIRFLPSPTLSITRQPETHHLEVLKEVDSSFCEPENHKHEPTCGDNDVKRKYKNESNVFNEFNELNDSKAENDNTKNKRQAKTAMENIEKQTCKKTEEKSFKKSEKQIQLVSETRKQKLVIKPIAVKPLPPGLKVTRRADIKEPKLMNSIEKESSSINLKRKMIKPPIPPKPKEKQSKMAPENPERVIKPSDAQRNQIRGRRFMRKFQIQSNFENISSTTDSVISSTTIGSEEMEEYEIFDLPYMVEVYRPWIKHQIDVTKVLSQLTLENEDQALIISKSMSSPPDAVDLMLEIIKQSEIPGIWQSFIDALENLEYVHLSQLLKNETEIHHNHSSAILRLVANDLAQRMCLPEFLDKVYEKQLLASSEYEHANAVFKEKGPEESARVIINYVDKHLPNWDVILADILDQSCMSDISDLFRMVEQQQAQLPHKHAESPRSDKYVKEKVLRERRLQHWEAKRKETQQTEDYNKTMTDIKINDFNALCVAVSEIQSNMKTLLRDVDEIKKIQMELKLKSD